MAGPRYSIIPASFFDDDRPGKAHYRVMGTLGRHTNETGWCRLRQATIAGEAGIARETVNRALSDLIEWGYVEKHATSGQSNAYRVIMDSREEPPEKGCDVDLTCEPEITGGCDAVRHKGCDVGDHRRCDVLRHNKNDLTLTTPNKRKARGRAAPERASQDLKSDLEVEVEDFAKRIANAESVPEIDNVWTKIKARKHLYPATEFNRLKGAANRRFGELSAPKQAPDLAARIIGEGVAA